MEKLISLGKRLKLYLTKKGIGVNEAGRIMETSGSQVNNILNGKKFGTDKLLIIFDKFDDLNPIWLITGEGEMLKNPSTSSENKIFSSTVGNILLESSNVINTKLSLLRICSALKEVGTRNFDKEEVEKMNIISENLTLPLKALEKQRTLTLEEEMVIAQSLIFALKLIYEYSRELDDNIGQNINDFNDLMIN